MLRFVNYRKSYGDKLIVSAEDLSLDAPFYWLKGGNGCGKTTLLQSVAGIIPFKGTIALNGKTPQRPTPAYRLAVNTAAAEPQYPDFLSGQDLIRLYMETKQGSAAQVEALTGPFGIEDFMADKIGTYSSGMKKKLSLALAFIGAPELILLDEPLITLDKEAVALLLQWIESRLATGVQIIMTSHQDVRLPFRILPEPLTITDRQLVPAV